MPLIARDVNRKERKQRINEVLKDLEIEDIAKKYPLQLSGGQQQRVALARALVVNSELIIADEPTGSLNSQTAGILMDLFEKVNKQGRTIVIATHDQNVADRCSKIYHIKDGYISMT